MVCFEQFRNVTRPRYGTGLLDQRTTIDLSDSEQHHLSGLLSRILAVGHEEFLQGGQQFAGDAVLLPIATQAGIGTQGLLPLALLPMGGLSAGVIAEAPITPTRRLKKASARSAMPAEATHIRPIAHQVSPFLWRCLSSYR